jgi:hypothetical protein
MSDNRNFRAQHGEGLILDAVKAGVRGNTINLRLRDKRHAAFQALLDENGLSEKVEKLYAGWAITLSGLMTKSGDLNRIRGEGGNTDRIEHLLTYYRGWATTCTRKYGALHMQITIESCFHGDSLTTVSERRKMDRRLVTSIMVEALGIEPEHAKAETPPPTLLNKWRAWFKI